MFKKIFVIMLICTFLITPCKYIHAGTWGENFPANGFKQMLEEIQDQIKEAIFSAAKIAAIKQATSSIEDSLYGNNSSPRNIKNFEEFLIADPQEKAVTYAQDFLTNSLRGTTSGDYSSSGGGSGELSKAIEAAGKSVIDNMKGKGTNTVDYSEYCSGDDFFSEGNFDCFDAIMANPLNTPIGMALAVDQAATAKYNQEKEVAMLEGTSSGVLPQKNDDGNVTIPSAIVEEIQEQQVTLPLESLANADNNAFSILIKSFAVKLVTGIIDRGLGEVEESSNKNSAAFKRQYNEDLGNLNNSSGPSSEYSNDSYSSSKKSQQQSEQPTGN